MNINFSMLSDNALTRSNASRINILRAKTNALATGGGANKVPFQKVIDGHPVLPADNARSNKKLMGVCKDFESIFVNQLFKVMRKTINQKNNILHGGHAEEVFSDMLYENYSKKVAKKGDFGFANVLYDHLSTINRGY